MGLCYTVYSLTRSEVDETCKVSRDGADSPFEKANSYDLDQYWVVLHEIFCNASPFFNTNPVDFPAGFLCGGKRVLSDVEIEAFECEDYLVPRWFDVSETQKIADFP